MHKPILLKPHLTLDGEGVIPVVTADNLPQHDKRFVLPLLPVAPHPEMFQTNYVNELFLMLLDATETAVDIKEVGRVTWGGLP